MKLYNSLTRTKDEFVPLEGGRIGMYVCGPTVYDEPHIGHARSAYIFDVIRRYLTYRGYEVKFVRNVTDVDDKIIDKARSVTGRTSQVAGLKDMVREVSQKYLDAYHDDMGLLGIGTPDAEPKATEYISKMIQFIELLVKNGCAYEAEGDVYFDIKKAKGYGKLSNQSLEKMEIGARVAPGEQKRDPLDFALWKAAKEDEPSWTSPWGAGRPGWHIECSVMSSDILGDEFDIHGGGIDLIFPHHENEIAQSEGAGKRFARYWMHNGLLTINGEKMAKSSGNFITIKDFIAKHKNADYLKLLFLGTHYRHPVDYSEEKIAGAQKQRKTFDDFFDKVNTWQMVRPGRAAMPASDRERASLDAIRQRFEQAMDDDFNTPLALASMFELVDASSKFISQDKKDAFEYAKGLLEKFFGVFGLRVKPKPRLSDEFTKLIRERERAREERDFAQADSLRRKIESTFGGVLADTGGGITFSGTQA